MAEDLENWIKLLDEIGEFIGAPGRKGILR